jgi:hypothetical protein
MENKLIQFKRNLQNLKKEPSNALQILCLIGVLTGIIIIKNKLNNRKLLKL